MKKQFNNQSTKKKNEINCGEEYVRLKNKLHVYVFFVIIRYLYLHVKKMIEIENESHD